MALFKVEISATCTHEYDVEAETQDEAERIALRQAQEGIDQIWFEVRDVDITNVKDVTND